MGFFPSAKTIPFRGVQMKCFGAYKTLAATKYTGIFIPGVAVLVPRTLPRAMLFAGLQPAAATVWQPYITRIWVHLIYYTMALKMPHFNNPRWAQRNLGEEWQWKTPPQCATNLPRSTESTHCGMDSSQPMKKISCSSRESSFRFNVIYKRNFCTFARLLKKVRAMNKVQEINPKNNQKSVSK